MGRSLDVSIVNFFFFFVYDCARCRAVERQPLPSLENTKQDYIYEIQIRGPSEERPQKRKPEGARKGRERARPSNRGGRGKGQAKLACMCTRER